MTMANDTLNYGKGARSCSQVECVDPELRGSHVHITGGGSYNNTGKKKATESR